MNDKNLFEQLGESNWLYVAVAATISSIAGWITRRGAQQRKIESDRAQQNWSQAGELRSEYRGLLEKALQREEELRRELLQRDKDLDAKEHLIGNLRMREVARAAKWNTLISELNERFPGEYSHLEKWSEPNGTKEIKKP